MKKTKRITALLLTIVMIVGMLAPMGPTANAAISTSTFETKVQEFISDSRWKNGIAWGDNQTPKLSKWSSTGCCAYAADFVAYVYGSTSAAWTSSDFTKFTNVNDIRTGDIIHTTGHWFVVLERTGDTFYTAEGNFDDKARVTKEGWGIKDGVIYNLKASSGARTFEYGYHYNFSNSASSGQGTTTSSSQIYYNIDMSGAVLKSRIQQQVSGDCAIVSMATIESYLYGTTSSADKTTVYNALVSKNGDNDYAYWGNCGYVTASIDWTAVYNQLAKGYPVIIHRPATSSKSQHWAVVAGYKCSTATLEKDKFIVVDVYHGSGGTDIYTSGSWRRSTTVDRMSYRKNGIAITSLSGIRFAIDHPVLVHQKGSGHGVYGYVTSNANLTSIQFTVTNINTGATVYNKTVTPNSKSYLIYNLDSEFTFAKWPVGEYFFTVIAKTASAHRVYNSYFQIASGWPTTAPTLNYTFNFDNNGGSGSISSQTVAYNGLLTIPTNQPTRDGYTFAGWTVKRNSDGKSYCVEGEWYTETQIKASGYTQKVYKPGEKYYNSYEWFKGAVTNRAYTFYAIWEANAPATYTVTYNANGGNGAPASQTKTDGVDLTLSNSVPTREGYTFLGWATSSSATNATYKAGAAFTANANTTLYAVWEKEEIVEDSEVIFTLGDVSGKPGDTVRVELSVESAVDINSIALYSFTYNSDVLTFEGFENYDVIAEKAFVSVFDEEKGTISIGLNEAEAYSGKLCDLAFKINENANEGVSSDVTALSVVKLDATNVTAYVDSATVTVSTQLLGDIDCNGVVDIKDAQLLFQHSMLPSIYTIDYVGNIDFTKDGVVDINDSQRLFQYSMLPDIYPIA